MLLPTIVDVSPKGQILIPANMRKTFGVKPKGKVYLLPHLKEQKIEIKPLKKNIVEELHGIFAGVDKEHSWTKELVVERRRDLAREEAEIAFWSKKKTGKKNT